MTCRLSAETTIRIVVSAIRHQAFSWTNVNIWKVKRNTYTNYDVLLNTPRPKQSAEFLFRNISKELIWQKTFVYWLRFYRHLFLKVRLTTSQSLETNRRQAVTRTLCYYRDLTLSQEFQPMVAQLSVPEILATASCRSNNTLTHWGRVTHICVSKLTNIVSDNGLPPGRRQAIIWTNTGILLIGPLGTNSSEILIGIRTFWFKKMRLKVSSAKWRPFCLGLIVLTNDYPIFWRTHVSQELRTKPTRRTYPVGIRTILHHTVSMATTLPRW